MARFTLPRDIYFGKGALEELKNLKGHKKAIVLSGGSSMKKFGFLDKVNTLLKETGLEISFIKGIKPDPSVETIMKGAETMRKFEPDVIVAIGGGSTIDAGKAMWVFYEHPELNFDDVKKPFSIPELRDKAIFVAIPSTSGTATEVTSASVVTDYAQKVKYPLVDFEIVPDIAILDTDIPQTMTPKLVAQTGMDALTHAIEAYVATNKSKISDPLAKESIITIYDNIVASYNGDTEARGEMHIAQCLAGMAFSNAGLGISHSLAHQIGVQYNISHGSCNAILLPYIVQFNAKTSLSNFAKLAKMLGLSGGTEKQLTNSLVKSIQNLNTELNIAPSLKENEIEEELFTSTVEYMAKNAVIDANTPTNPRETSFEDMKKILESVYYGKPITF